jgi:hypothetical protein
LALFSFIPADGFASIVTDALAMIATLLAPFVAFALIIHWFERITQLRLAERFGWRSVMWTGWLGTPIHELSHAAMCVLFRHRVDDIALFEPDRESGRLGYVKHSFRRGNWFEEIGNLFIGIAPLIGGSIALAALLWLFYPDAAAAAVTAAQNSGQSPVGAGDIMARTWELASQIAAEILSFQNFWTARFWIFIYLVLCVGSHMAPSWSDYRGASRGVWLAGGLLLAVTLLMAAVGVDLNAVNNAFIGATGPLYAVLGLTVLLCFIATVFVYMFTFFIPRFFRVR